MKYQYLTKVELYLVILGFGSFVYPVTESVEELVHYINLHDEKYRYALIQDFGISVSTENQSQNPELGMEVKVCNLLYCIIDLQSDLEVGNILMLKLLNSSSPFTFCIEGIEYKSCMIMDYA